MGSRRTTGRARLAFALAGALAVVPGDNASAAECTISAQPLDGLAESPRPEMHDTPNPGAAHTGLHGQILLGRDAPRILYHLPVFMGDPWRHPHNFQVVLAVSPVDPSDAAIIAYAQDRTEHPSAFYTAVPPDFDQMDLLGDEMRPAPLDRFDPVAIFRGHFEKPAERKLIAADAHLSIERVIYFNEFDPFAEPSSTLAYLLFGRPAELYMVHLLSGPPDFDQIIEVTAEGAGPTGEQLEHGLFVRVEGRSNTVHERLVAGEEISCGFVGEKPSGTPAVVIRVIGERYCEVGEVSHTVGEVAGNSFGTPGACRPRS